jgi:hypothetical protein
MAGGGALSRSVSPSSPTYFAKPPSLSRMEGRARYSPDYADIDMIVDPNATYSRASTPRGRNAFRFTIDLNSDINNGSPDLRRAPGGSTGHVTDRTGLPAACTSAIAGTPTMCLAARLGHHGGRRCKFSLESWFVHI